MAQLTDLNRVSIAYIAVYTPSLFIGILLSIRHGFRRNAGWLFLIILSLVRIIGGALNLATINDPANVSLLTGAATLQNIGLSPLILILLALVNRVLENVQYNRDTTILQPRLLRLVQLVLMVGFILGIVGGSNQSGNIANAVQTAKTTGRPFVYPPVPVESRAGYGLFIAGFALLVVATVLLAPQVSAADKGEKRVLAAVAAAEPFVLVRLVYGAIANFDSSDANFRLFASGPHYITYLVAMSVVMEMVAVAIIEIMGLTLQKIPEGRRGPPQEKPLGRLRGRFAARNEPPKERHVVEQESGVNRV